MITLLTMSTHLEDADDETFRRMTSVNSIVLTGAGHSAGPTSRSRRRNDMIAPPFQ